ncbi:MAPEG family protein [Cognatiyoonia sp. IB215446]|uniref:MAPEG family protein n=1 Tax=Cognatiyoonia sp. IB215446 TaxID=3097355 RepID=UPI002A0F84A6|nr:MAPEG family protein [Cognatiyoonia sp. IB215446]MDX8346860.1 MAPEG family protein [Cognatiyoonia sp. IB215446]
MENLPHITLAVVAVLVLMSIPMAIAVGLRRAKTGILLLHGEDDHLLRLMRAHGNFVEYVPLALVALAAAEIAGVAPWLVLGCGGALILARLVHYFGLRKAADSMGRLIGAGLTNITLLILGLAILWQLGAAF